MNNIKVVIHKGLSSNDAIKALIDKRVDGISSLLEDMNAIELGLMKGEINECMIKKCEAAPKGAVSFFAKCYNVCIWNANSEWRAVV